MKSFPPKRLTVLLAAVLMQAAVLIGELVPPAAQAQPPMADQSPEQAFVFVIDRSASTTASTGEEIAAIEAFLRLARFSDARLLVGAIILNSEQEKLRIIGDPNGGLTSDLDAFRRALRQADQPPVGVSPIGEALEVAHAGLMWLPPEMPKTIVLFSDGVAGHGRLREDRYPVVREWVAEYRARLGQNAAPEFIDAVVENARQLRGPEGEELQRIQQNAQQEAITQIAGAIAADPTIRLISIAPNDYAEINRLHTAAGGAKDDIVTQPNVSPIEAFDHFGLMSRLTPWERLDRDPVLAARSDDIPAGWSTYSLPIDPIADRLAAVFLFEQPIVDFDTNVTMQVAVGGEILDVAVGDAAAMGDDRAVVLTNHAGEAVAVWVEFDGVGDSAGPPTLRLDAASPTGATEIPLVRPFVYQRPSENTRIVFGVSQSVGAEVTPQAGEPIRLAADAPHSYLFHVLGDDGERQPIDTVTMTVASEEGGVEMTLAEREHERFRFESEQTALPRGVYDVRLTVTTASGLSWTIDRPAAIEVEVIVPNLLISPLLERDGDAPLAIREGHLVVGTLGDTLREAEYTLLVTLSETETPVRVAVQPQQAVDAAGNTLTGLEIAARRGERTLRPGQTERLRLKVTLPEHLPPEIVDGPVDFSLTLSDVSTGAALRTTAERYEAELDDPTAARILLRRPRILISTTQIAPVPTSAKTPPTHRLCPVALPTDLPVAFTVSHDSEGPQTLLLPPEIPLATSTGARLSAATMHRVEPQESRITIEPGQAAVATYRAAIGDRVERAVSGTLVVSGASLREGRIEVAWKPPVRTVAEVATQSLAGVAGIGLLFALVLTLAAARLRRLLPGQTLTIEGETGNAAGLVVRRGRDDSLLIESDGEADHLLSRQGQRRPKPLAGPLIVTEQDMRRDRIQITRLGEPDAYGEPTPELTVRLRRILRGSGQPQIEATIEKAPPYRDSWTRRTRARTGWLLVLIAAAAGLAMLQMPAGLSWLQAVGDRFPQLADWADRWPLPKW